MLHPDAELKNWNDWTDPDFFVTTRHRESRVVPLFLRQILPSRLLRTKMTLSGWCLVAVSLGLGLAAYNTANNILFLALSLLLSSLILSGILSLINFKKLGWNLRPPEHLRVGQIDAAEIDLSNRKKVFPSVALRFLLLFDADTKEETVCLRNTLDPGESCKLKWVLNPEQRGQFKLRLLGIQSKYPFGFLQKTIKIDSETTVFVWPARIAYTFPVSSGGRRMKAGATKKQPGQGSDLLNIRPYEYGDAPRFIDWKATARSRRLMIRQLAQEGGSGYHLYIDSDETRWHNELQFEQLCSLVCSLAEDLFHRGRLESVRIDDSIDMPIRALHELHTFWDHMSLLKLRREPLKFFPGQRSNCLTFGPVGEDGVAIYLEGSYAGQTDDK